MRFHLLPGAIAACAMLHLTTASATTKQSALELDSITITAVEESRDTAAQWGLEPAEWHRYRELMEGPLGTHSPNIDPLSALGIEAKTAEERDRYAELQVRMETARVTKLLAYQNAYDRAYKRLYPDILPVNLVATAPASQASPTAYSARTSVFVTQDCPACIERVKTLLNTQESFDLYLIGSQGDDSRLRHWAAKASITMEQVKSRQVTLNHDAGRWISIGGKGELPAVLNRVAGQWVRQ